MRNWGVVLFLAVIIIGSFIIWGEWFTNIFSQEGVDRVLSSYGQWAWLIGILLLVGDLFLPLPATIIMSGLGLLYGPFLGGLLATLGNFLSGILAYGLCRSFGRKGAVRILGREDLKKGESIFNRNGGWIVAISRWLPILPEIVSCMAGLNQMRFGMFSIGLACGSLPLGFTFAYIGYYGFEHPFAAVLISAVLPLVLWIIAQYFLRRVLRQSIN